MPAAAPEAAAPAVEDHPLIADLTLTENGTTQQVPVMGTVTLTEGGT